MFGLSALMGGLTQQPGKVSCWVNLFVVLSISDKWEITNKHQVDF